MAIHDNISIDHERWRRQTRSDSLECNDAVTITLAEGESIRSAIMSLTRACVFHQRTNVRQRQRRFCRKKSYQFYYDASERSLR